MNIIDKIIVKKCRDLMDESLMELDIYERTGNVENLNNMFNAIKKTQKLEKHLSKKTRIKIYNLKKQYGYFDLINKEEA